VKANVWPVPTGAKYHGPQAAVGGAPMQPVRLWTSTLKRTVHTARHIEHPWLKLDGGGEWHQVSAHATGEGYCAHSMRSSVNAIGTLGTAGTPRALTA
jgi:hypothetical protein